MSRARRKGATTVVVFLLRALAAAVRMLGVGTHGQE